MHLVAINDQVSDRRLGVGTVDGNAKSIPAASRSIAAFKRLLNIVDVVLQQLYMRASPHHAYTQWSEPMFGGPEIANFKTLDPYVAPALYRKYRASPCGSKMPCVEHGRFAGIASKSNEPIGRVAGRLNGYEFFVDTTPHIDGTSRTRGVCGMLNGAPRCRLGARIRIIPSRRHIEGGVGLAKGPGDAHQQHNKRQKFHVRPLQRKHSTSL